MDITSIQNLIDVRNQLDRYAAPHTVDWHFACLNNRWTKRALASAGFGFPTEADAALSRWKPVFSVAEIGGSTSAAAAAESLENEKGLERKRSDVEQAKKSKGEDNIQADGSSASSDGLSRELTKSKAYVQGRSKQAVVHGLNRPLFHIDLTSALQSAIANAERRSDPEPKSVGPTI